MVVLSLYKVHDFKRRRDRETKACFLYISGRNMGTARLKHVAFVLNDAYVKHQKNCVVLTLFVNINAKF